MAPLFFVFLTSSMTFQTPAGPPVVNADHSVSFAFKSPNAQKVEINVEGHGTHPMSKSSDGVWTYTSPPLPPQIYGYTISVDGTAQLDPSNPEIKPNLIWVSNMVTVPGNPPAAWEVQAVPHGAIHHHFYRSKVIGIDRDYFVYTPPNYRPNGEKLPVLYLLHGYSDTAVGWTEVGKAHVILDNLIAQKKANPMIVVMPLGYGLPNFASPTQKFTRQDSVTHMNNFREALLTEVMPRVAEDYRVRTDRDHTAIAGLSMGGGESLFVGLTNPDKFAYVGGFSSGGFPVDKPEDLLGTPKGKDFKLLWMTCGTDDSLVGFQRGFAQWLKDHGYPITTSETAGGHEWLLWREDLIQFAGRIFSDR